MSPFDVVGGVLLFLLLTALVSHWWHSRPLPEDRPEPAPPASEMRACRGCGATYHKSWGSLCPDCSGAD